MVVVRHARNDGAESCPETEIVQLHRAEPCQVTGQRLRQESHLELGDLVQIGSGTVYIGGVRERARRFHAARTMNLQVGQAFLELSERRQVDVQLFTFFGANAVVSPVMSTRK